VRIDCQHALVTLVAGGGVEAARRVGVGGGGARIGRRRRRGVRAREARFLGRGGRGRRRRGASAGATRQLQALPAARGGHPGAPDMRVTLEATAVAARAAAAVRAALLRLVAAVLARRRAGPGPAAGVVQHGEGLLAGGPIRGRRLLVPELDGASGRHGRLAVAVAGGGGGGGGVSVDEGALRRGDEREHGVVGGGRPLGVVVVERARGRDHEHPDVTGGAYRPVAERRGGGGGSGSLVARRRGPPEPCR